MPRRYTAKNRTKGSQEHDVPPPGMHDVTFHGLHGWHKNMFEELGWMVLLKGKGGYNYKIAAYKKSLHHLILSLEEAKSKFTEADRQHDIEVLHRNVHVLDDFVKKYL